MRAEGKGHLGKPRDIIFSNLKCTTLLLSESGAG